MDEFELIRRYFDRQIEADGVIVGIGDDGAVLQANANCDQIQVIDTLVSGVHFPHATDPSDIAYRAVAVNLSDIAAMGACPRWMTLALTLNDASDEWLEAFAEGLFAAADIFGVTLVGGDTTRGPDVVVTVSITAELESGSALLRDGANVEDSIFVSGTLGDAAAGLQMLQQSGNDEYLVGRFLRPTPRLETGRRLIGHATAAIDISDGLAGDVRKLLSASGVGGEINIDLMPLSNAIRAKFSVDEQNRFALYGGDDYELCFTAPTESVVNIPGITKIGAVTASPQLMFMSQGNIVEVNDSGYRHFK